MNGEYSMKKLLDKIWEWIKETAWFQVVCLVGVVVAIVLCIQPITRSIQGAITEANRTKYYENNKINFDTLIEKIDNLDKGGEEFAVLFGTGLPSDDDTQKAIAKYEKEDYKPVKIYYFQYDITDENKANYNFDENYYNYYKVEPEMTRDLLRAGFASNVQGQTSSRDTVYGFWKKYTADETTWNKEVEQTSEGSADTLNSNTIMWFRSKNNIAEGVKNFSTVANPAYSKLQDNYDFHIAKIYLTLTDSQSTATDNYIKIYSGLKKFFSESVVEL